MRTYYFFKINTILNPMYEKKSINVYKILNKINSFNKKEYLLAKKIYSKVVDRIEKDKINSFILMNHINDIYYTKNQNIHELICDKENSKLIVYNTFLKLVTTNDISTFFKDINSLDNNFFVIDFINKDYFYLYELKNKVLAS